MVELGNDSEEGGAGVLALTDGYQEALGEWNSLVRV